MLSYMYTPGSVPVTFEVDGLRFGCAMGIEVHFPEVFAEYERLDVDGVLFSTGGGQTSEGTAAFATEAQGHAAADIDNRAESIEIAVSKARPWRRRVRAGVYDAHLVTDDRSDDRVAF
jgi:predicted amidohydrolase